MFWHTWLIRMGFDQLFLCAAEKFTEFLGYEGLKEHQRQIILEIMKKTDVVLRDFIGYHRFEQLIHTIHRRIVLPELLCTRSVSEQKNTVTIFASRQTRKSILHSSRTSDIYAKVTRPLKFADSHSYQTLFLNI